MAILDAVRQLVQDLGAGALVVIPTALYILINILRGKAGFDIPFITKLFNKIKSKTVKTWIIVGLFGVVGIVMSLDTDDPITIWSILDGCLGGLAIGMTTMGVRHASKTTMESEKIQAFKNKVKTSIKKTFKRDKKKVDENNS